MSWWHPRWPTIAVAILLLASCKGVAGKHWIELRPEGPGSGPTFRITGVVRHLELEGGLVVIRDAEGTQYNPLNLPQAFRLDGMLVEADARRSDNVASIGMAGPVVELLRIRRLR